MKNKSNIFLIVGILIVTVIIAVVCYGNIKTRKNPVATIEVVYKDADGNEKTGTVKMELYSDQAPETVANFITLANNGYYNGLKFHRIAENFVVQGGDKNGDGSGSANVSDLNKSIQAGSKDDYKYSIKGEFAANGINNTLKFGKGIVGMARSDYSSYGLNEEGYNSGSSQFFITTTDDSSKLKSLNQNYASFGKVIEGYEYIEEIAKVYAGKEASKSTNTEGENATEEDFPVMKNVSVDTFGGNYGLPTTINYESILNKVSQYQNYFNQLQSGSGAGVTTAE